ncbi:hypothetical protein PENANT_c002G02063 [Penicillium antarcticum]|uniref:Uncharacterized protein n=1 Tax=Penicillium antarcticum TaxID=416450 RepID=A0A1V6QJW9_9EURO|nr:uncharacterized protein N7508_006433 [Penicillium antarcticum]KAJ5301570.1 hypothetical protein N7508_006433 [Penicillium antarcticum]OQD89510.1 hypothetical protein PENANT_c002G02063 [Penicillium antarcticum]
MDFLKKAAEKATGGEHQQENHNNQQNDDYVDKAFAAGVSKSGYNIDRSMQEKITDAGREAYEKATGNKVSEKISN